MTVQTEVYSVSHQGDGTTGPYTIPFYFIKDADLLVLIETRDDGTLSAPLVLDTDYTLEGAADEAGGTLTLAVALTADYNVIIKLDPDIVQKTHFTRNDKFPTKAAEQALDRLTQICQRLTDRILRAIKAPESETNNQEFNATQWDARAGKVVGFDGGGNLSLLSEAELVTLLTGLATAYDSDVQMGDTATVDFVLPGTPASADALAVYVSGVRQSPGVDYTLADDTVTFTVAPPAVSILFVWSNAQTVALVPADGSITTPKLADGVLAATVEGLAKMTAGFFTATVDGLAKFADGFWAVGGHEKWEDGFWAASNDVREKFEDGIWTFAKIDPGAIASEAEAEAGTSATKLMTPERTSQAITALAGTVNKGSYSVRGADCKNNAGTPNTKFDLDADSITLRDANNNIVTIHNPGAAIINDTAVAGPAANGRDQAGAFAAGWVHFYWIYDAVNDTLATIASNVAPPTGPTLFDDFAYWAYAGAVYYDGAALKKVWVRGSEVIPQTVELIDLGGLGGKGTATNAEQNASLATFIPPNALVALCRVLVTPTAGNMAIRLLTGVNFLTYDEGGVDYHSMFFDAPNVGQNLIYIRVGGTNVDFFLYLMGYRIPNGGE